MLTEKAFILWSYKVCVKRTCFLLTVMLEKLDLHMTLCICCHSLVLDMLAEQAFAPGSHILGDSTYALYEQLLTPFKDNGHLSDIQAFYNTTHAKCHSTIERAFAHLAGHFRWLKYLDASRLDLMTTLVIACCALHNICIMNEEEFNKLAINSDESEIQSEPCPARTAIIKCDDIANSLYLGHRRDRFNCKQI